MLHSFHWVVVRDSSIWRMYDFQDLSFTSTSAPRSLHSNWRCKRHLQASYRRLYMVQSSPSINFHLLQNAATRIHHVLVLFPECFRLQCPCKPLATYYLRQGGYAIDFVCFALLKKGKMLWDGSQPWYCSNRLHFGRDLDPRGWKQKVP